MALVPSSEQVYEIYFHLILYHLQDKNYKFDCFSRHSSFQQNYMNEYKTNPIRIQKALLKSKYINK